mmetsp:Transcript_6450/g.13253  ORF Transcript_6450/g.13253 Transcript_6450/m.13253 type:complete len:246 (-) Transcript_6450:109-846(-)
MPLTCKDSVNLLFMLTSSSLLAWGPMTAEQGGPNNTFTYHPFLMGLGFSFMITIGFWIFNYEDLPGEWIDTRSSRRRVHALVQVTGIIMIIGGYISVVRAHNSSGAKLFAVSKQPWGFDQGPSILRLVHIILGYFTLFLVAVQFSVGVLKFRVLEDDVEGNDSSYSIHETIGNTLYACGLSNVLLGVWLWAGWPLPIKCVISLTLVTSLAFGPRWDGTRGYLSDKDDTPPAPTTHHHQRGAENTL